MRSVSQERADSNESIVELRLGVVLYGGISLAIYMHGVTKELEKLVVASRAYEENPGAGTNPFTAAEQQAERAYWEILRRAHGHDGVITRVVVDVVAGTSAGGINGVVLCKALAQNRTQDPLRNLWFDKGDIKQLLGGNRWNELRDLVALTVELPFNHAHPPLDGNAMFGWLVDALDQVDATQPAYTPPAGQPAGSPLVPDGQELELFVTTTDYYGYRQALPIASPPVVNERRNRHVYEFAYLCEAGRVTCDQFDARHNVALAFAARSTSSFPGAFPPLSIPDAQARLHELGRPAIELASFKDEFFRAYELSRADAAATYFVDGGVLANHPFGPVIDSIVARRAESEVRRRLLYLEPDPGPEVVDPNGARPTLFGTVWAGLSTIAGAQPILDDIVYVNDFNARVRRISEIVNQAREPIAAILEQDLHFDLAKELQAIDQPQLTAHRQYVEQFARQKADYAWASYFQIRVRSIVDQFAAGICTLCSYRTPGVENNVQSFVGLIVEAWAKSEGYIGDRPAEQKQADLVRQFDVGYLRRRLAFVVEGINQLYGQQGAPPRLDLNRAKAALYDGIDELSGVIHGESVDATLKNAVCELFPLAELLGFLDAPSLDDRVKTFVVDRGHRLTEAFNQLGQLIAARMEEAYHQLYEDFRTITAAWPVASRREILIRYIGFPFWDVLIYPVTRLSQAGELREIDVMRFSPADSTALAGATLEGKSTPKKLLGVQKAHFGAFFSLEARQNDYLWGRLDAAERLVGLLLPQPPSPSDLKPLLAAILAEEQHGVKPPLTEVGPLLDRIKGALAAMPDRP